jgi:hypothetical protein
MWLCSWLPKERWLTVCFHFLFSFGKAAAEGEDEEQARAVAVLSDPEATNNMAGAEDEPEPYPNFPRTKPGWRTP